MLTFWLTLKHLMRAALVVAAGVLLITTSLLSSNLHKVRSELAQSQSSIRQLKEELRKQQASAKVQAYAYRKLNNLAEAFEGERMRLTKESDEKQNQFRVLAKNAEAGHQCVPDDIAVRLYRYANRLRSDSTSRTAGSSDKPGTDPTPAPCRLTYGQTVYWTERLLSALDEANRKLENIRLAEKLSTESLGSTEQ
ncbi:MAG: hypothetical protein QM578_26480 [Pantoea sp.]|uniref:hypothetical protein n=1 Tax=Pantoea sp. TaxID=69393 RepID=UPI0039E2E9CD